MNTIEFIPEKEKMENSIPVHDTITIESQDSDNSTTGPIWSSIKSMKTKLENMTNTINSEKMQLNNIVIELKAKDKEIASLKNLNKKKDEEIDRLKAQIEKYQIDTDLKNQVRIQTEGINKAEQTSIILDETVEFTENTVLEIDQEQSDKILCKCGASLSSPGKTHQLHKETCKFSEQSTIIISTNEDLPDSQEYVLASEQLEPKIKSKSDRIIRSKIKNKTQNF